MFKVGDSIKGKENDKYVVTNEKMKKGQILKIGESFVEIKVLEHLDKDKIGQIYIVNKYNFDECFELLKPFTKSDLKDGDIVTFRNNRRKTVKGQSLTNENGSLHFNHYTENLKNVIDNKFDIVKVERPVQYETVFERKEEILDEAEKRYLRDVIRPFRGRIESIAKEVYDSYYKTSHIVIRTSANNIAFPPLETEKRMYEGMKLGREYSLEELGL